MAREWFRLSVRNEAPDVAELHVFDEIGQSFWGDDTITAQAVVDKLNALPASVTKVLVRVNSPGGDVFDAIAIANALKAQRDQHGRTVEARIEGLAASAATIITAAAKPIRIATNALMMIHRPTSLSYGESEEHRRNADALDKIEQAIIATYQWTSTKSADELAAMMKAETWMNAQEAVANGFATQIIEEEDEALDANPVVARFRPQALRAIPQRFAAALTPLIRKPVQAAAHADVMRLCNAAGLDLAFAQSLVDARVSSADVEARIAGEKKTRDAEATRRTHIRAACTVARLPMLADSYIAGGMSLDAVKAQLVTVVALVDLQEIETFLTPESGPPPASAGWKKAFDGVTKGLLPRGARP